MNATREQRQALFDISLNHVLTQGKPSTAPHKNGIVCRYKSPDGCGCGAAPFIDWDYVEEHGIVVEGVRFSRLPERAIIHMARGHEDWITDYLQVTHDNAAMLATGTTGTTEYNENFLDLYRSEMKTVAKTNHLTYKENTNA